MFVLIIHFLLAQAISKCTHLHAVEPSSGRSAEIGRAKSKVKSRLCKEMTQVPLTKERQVNTAVYTSAVLNCVQPWAKQDKGKDTKDKVQCRNHRASGHSIPWDNHPYMVVQFLLCVFFFTIIHVINVSHFLFTSL